MKVCIKIHTRLNCYKYAAVAKRKTWILCSLCIKVVHHISSIAGEEFVISINTLKACRVMLFHAEAQITEEVMGSVIETAED